MKRGRNHRDGLPGEDEPYSKSKSQDDAKAHPSNFYSLGEDPSTSKKFKYGTSSISTVTSFALPTMSDREGHSRVIDEDEYQQFCTESNGKCS